MTVPWDEQEAANAWELLQNHIYRQRCVFFMHMNVVF